MTRPWGCPACKHPVGLVQDTGADEDGHKVRLRACTACGTLWATEEVTIAVEAFYTRNASRRRAARERAKANKGIRSCRWCESGYREGSYSEHCRTSRLHNRALRPLNRNRTRHRRYQRRWARERAA